ncbi:PQLC3 [Acanthosepion pharaonis]|uniref:PQLC3 n=1 Tax=Acanthosepion pharaonis TaxID=158019 RepID=A0A812B3G2_ACAPH|nr:PQLC3 [Sepia pharaonis]
MGTVTKMPQIYSVFKAKKTKSISLKSLIVEGFGHSVMLTYHFALHYPFSSYSEYTFLVPQDLILITLLLFYDDLFSLKVSSYYLLYLGFFYLLAFNKLPFVLLKMTMMLSTPISVISKLLQIHALFITKDAGQLNLATWCLLGTSSLARLFTTLVLTGDFVVLINFGCSVILNFLIAAMIIYYRKAAKKKV